MSKFKTNRKYYAGAALTAMAATSQAAAIAVDTSDIVSQISAGATAISAIGVAMLSVFALMKCYQLVKGALGK